MASLVRSASHADILGSPARLYAVLIDAARAMTTDAALTPGTMLTIGESLHSLSSKSVQFVTVPEVPYPRDPQAETKFAQPQASALFTAIARDHALPERARPAGRLASRPGARHPGSPRSGSWPGPWAALPGARPPAATRRRSRAVTCRPIFPAPDARRAPARPPTAGPDVR